MRDCAARFVRFDDGRVKLSLKFNPHWQTRRSLDDRRLWMLSAIALGRRTAAAPEWSVEILWKRLLAVGALLLVLFYLLFATVLYLWWARQPANQVGWIDVTLAPVRWEALREKRGDTAIAAALERIQAKDYVEGYYGLRVGLGRSPGNAKGRVTLARMMAASDPAGTIRMLEAGLDAPLSDPALIHALFGAYAGFGSYQRAKDTAEKLLQRTPPLPAPLRRAVAGEYAAMMLATEDAAGALKILQSYASSDADRADATVARVRIRALIASHQLDEARAELRSLPRLGRADQRLEAELAIESRDADALESVLRQIRADESESPAPYLFSIQAWHRMGRATLRERETRIFLDRWGGQDSALQLLAALAVNLDLPIIVNQAEGAAVAHRLNAFAFRLHLVEVAIRHGEFDDAFRRVREVEATIPTLPPMQRAYPEFIQQLARSCVAGGEQQTPALVSQLAGMRGRALPQMYLLASDALRRAGFPESARQVVETGLRSYPYNDQLLSRRTDLEALVAARQAAVTPEPQAVTPIVVLPTTGAQALALIDQDLAAGKFTTVRDLQRAIRAASPAWLPSVEAGLARREVELALATQDAITARTLVHTYLQRPRPVEDVARLAQLARDFVSRNRFADARWLKEEIESVSPAAAQLVRSLALPDDDASALASAENLVAALERHLAAGQPGEAIRLLDEARKRDATWLVKVRVELLGCEVRARFAADQRPLALAAFKELVVRAGASRAAAFKLARTYWTDGQSELASLLAREAVRLLPGDKAALSLQREIEAPPGGV